tara:strand:+ start:1003 stop:1335 length:333 start_codon:yes stop_codon:yes gene_type:complete
VQNITDLFKTVKEDERYLVEDNTDLKTLVVSKTSLKPLKETTGHSHIGQEEVYIFTTGEGYLESDDETIKIKEGDIVTIDDGDFHKVRNTSPSINLNFTCIFPGKRYDHK